MQSILIFETTQGERDGEIKVGERNSGITSIFHLPFFSIIVLEFMHGGWWWRWSSLKNISSLCLIFVLEDCCFTLYLPEGLFPFPHREYEGH